MIEQLRLGDADQHVRFGFRFTIGAAVAVAVLAVALSLSGIVHAIVRNTLGLSVDDCDRSAWERCGVKVITDNLSGLQYLMSPQGGLTPRLAPDGKQVRVKP